MIKVQPSQFPGVCSSCRYGQVVELRNDVKVWCHNSHFTSLPIPGVVERCSRFEDKPTQVQEFTEKAWILHIDKGRKAGFKPPE